MGYLEVLLHFQIFGDFSEVFLLLVWSLIPLFGEHALTAFSASEYICLALHVVCPGECDIAPKSVHSAVVGLRVPKRSLGSIVQSSVFLPILSGYSVSCRE